MLIDQDVYLEEMASLVNDAKVRILAEWTDEVYTVIDAVQKRPSSS